MRNLFIYSIGPMNIYTVKVESKFLHNKY
jgi:hypothetical protein